MEQYNSLNIWTLSLVLLTLIQKKHLSPNTIQAAAVLASELQLPTLGPKSKSLDSYPEFLLYEPLVLDESSYPGLKGNRPDDAKRLWMLSGDGDNGPSYGHPANLLHHLDHQLGLWTERWG